MPGLRRRAVGRSRFCPHCGWEKGTYLDAKGKVRTLSPNRVSVADVDLPFWSIIKVAMKWAVASVPAVLLLVLLVLVAIPFFSMIMDQLNLPQLLGK